MELRLSLILSVLLNLSVYSCFSQEYSYTYYDVNTIDGKPIVCDAVACSPEGHFLTHVDQTLYFRLNSDEFRNISLLSSLNTRFPGYDIFLQKNTI